MRSANRRTTGDAESLASGVMMIPIPRRGVFRRADGVDEARAVAGIDDVRITAKPDQLLMPLPEGASYLGFIFARARATAATWSARCAPRTRGSRSPSTRRSRCSRAADALQSLPWLMPAVPRRRRRPPRNKSGRTVFCVKFQKELPGLDAPPWPGELGQRIFDSVSVEAWKLWEERMKMILNEYRLMPWQKEAQDLVAKHMEDFFFGEGAALPPGYVPQQAK